MGRTWHKTKQVHSHIYTVNAKCTHVRMYIINPVICVWYNTVVHCLCLCQFKPQPEALVFLQCRLSPWRVALQGNKWFQQRIKHLITVRSYEQTTLRKYRVTGAELATAQESLITQNKLSRGLLIYVKAKMLKTKAKLDTHKAKTNLALRPRINIRGYNVPVSRS